MELGGRRGQEGEHGGRRGKGCWIPGGLGQARKLMRRRQPAESKQIGKIDPIPLHTYLKKRNFSPSSPS